MRLVKALILLVFIGLTFFWTWINYPSVKYKTLNFFRSKKCQTLEARYSATAIMEAHRRFLLKDSEHTFASPKLVFHPYLLMEVKFSRSQDKTGEGVILWSLFDGEMVIDTHLWEKTHGFADCIRAGADKENFKIINALAANGGQMNHEALQKYLNAESDTLNSWINTCKAKQLIVQNGNNYRLHFQNPKMQVIPETKIDQWLVSKQFKNASKVPKKYRSGQIENIAKAAFGQGFTIRKTTEIFIPVYNIAVQNPDGSQMTTFWNALNGQKLSQMSSLE